MLKKYLLSELIFLPLKNFIVHLVALQEKSKSWLGITKQAFLPFLLSGRTILVTAACLLVSDSAISFLGEVHVYRN